MATRFLTVLRKDGKYNHVIDANSIGQLITIRNADKYDKVLVYKAEVKDTQDEKAIRAYLEEVNSSGSFNEGDLVKLLDLVS